MTNCAGLVDVAGVEVCGRSTGEVQRVVANVVVGGEMQAPGRRELQ